MDDHQWHQLLISARRILGSGSSAPWASRSWCAWTTFSSLKSELTYWRCGLPDENELLSSRTADGGLWTQSFAYADIAHFIIPATFYWEKVIDSQFQWGYKEQDLPVLSEALARQGITGR